MSDIKIGQESTQEYFQKLDIKVGDRFSEMMAFFINVISIDNGKIVTIEGNPSSNMEIREYDSAEALRNRCEYSTLSGSYWVYYLGNDRKKANDWVHYYKNNYYKTDAGQRQLNIEKILYSI